MQIDQKFKKFVKPLVLAFIHAKDPDARYSLAKCLHKLPVNDFRIQAFFARRLDDWEEDYRVRLIAINNLHIYASEYKEIFVRVYSDKSEPALSSMALMALEDIPMYASLNR